MIRPSWDDYFRALAQLVATRSTCSRASVGSVIVRDNRILACGHNGAPSGERHCDHSEPMKDVATINLKFHCAVSVHAEANSIADCARRGVPCEGATIYVTHPPCDTCSKLIKSAGIVKVVVP